MQPQLIHIMCTVRWLSSSGARIENFQFLQETCVKNTSVSHLIFAFGLDLLGEGKGVGQAGHLVIAGGNVGGVAGLGRGVTAAILCHGPG